MINRLLKCIPTAVTHAVRHTPRLFPRYNHAQSPSTLNSPLAPPTPTPTPTHPHSHIPVSRPFRLGVVSRRNAVPNHITRPRYATPNGSKAAFNDGSTDIRIKSKEEIALMKSTCKLASQIREYAGSLVKPGVSLDEIDRLVHIEILKNNAYPSPLGYAGFPKSIGTAVNQVLCHGIPDDQPLMDGDIVTLDITVYRDGFHGDCNATFKCGSIDSQRQRLIDVSRSSVFSCFRHLGPGVEFGVVSDEISRHVKATGLPLLVNAEMCGHGIGRDFHEPPLVRHSNQFLNPESKILMKPGMTFTIEPIIVFALNGESSLKFHTLQDNWTLISDDGSLCSQHEETVLITESGCELLTKH